MRDEFKPGTITARQAKLLNDLLEVAEQFRRLTVAPPLSLTRPAGIPQLTVDPNRLTVEEVDGSPSVDSVGTVRFDQTDGFVVSEAETGVARVDIDAEVLRTVLGTACAGLGWLAALRPTDCLTVSVEGESGAGTVTLSSSDGETWANTDDALTICDSTFVVTVTLDDDYEPHLTLTFTEYSGSGNETPFVVRGRVDCSGCAYLIAAFSRYKLCPCSAPTSSELCDNLIRLRVEASPGCGTTDVRCGSTPYLLPRTLYATFLDDLEQLGTVPIAFGTNLADVQQLNSQAFGHQYAAPGVELSTPTPGDPAPVAYSLAYFSGAGGTWCSAFFYVQGTFRGSNTTKNFWAALADIPESVAADPFELEVELTPHADLAAYGITATSRVRITELNPGGTAAAGYTVPGWYVAGGQVVYLDATNKCAPWDIECGPYEDQAAAAAALAAGCNDDCDSIHGWHGAGWYCVLVAGSCTAAELLESDRCDQTVVICDGPYADEATAAAACTGSGSGSGSGSGGGVPTGTVACCDGFTPNPEGASSVTVSILSQSPAACVAGGTAALENFPMGGAQGVVTASANYEWIVTCLSDGSGWQAVLSGTGGTYPNASGVLVEEFCGLVGATPTLYLTYQFTVAASAACPSGATVLVRFTFS